MSTRTSPPAPVPKRGARSRTNGSVPPEDWSPLRRAAAGEQNRRNVTVPSLAARRPRGGDESASDPDRIPASMASAEVGADVGSAPREEAPSPKDLLRRYLREIGRVALLTAEQEVALGLRIERGQQRM